MYLQVPQGVPHPQDENLFDPGSVVHWVVFLIIPALLIAAYFFFRKRARAS